MGIKEDEFGKALISEAAYGRYNTCELLIKNGANVNNINARGCTALHLAADYGYIDICKLLIDNNCNVDKEDYCKQTALHFAVEGGKLEICELLLESGADPNILDEHINSPLHLAASKGYGDICKLLILNKAYTDIKNDRGLTAEQLATINGHQDTFELIKSVIKNQSSVQGYNGILYITVMETRLYTWEHRDGESGWQRCDLYPNEAEVDGVTTTLPDKDNMTQTAMAKINELAKWIQSRFRVSEGVVIKPINTHKYRKGVVYIIAYEAILKNNAKAEVNIYVKEDKLV